MKAGKQQSSQQSNRFKGTNHTLLKAPTILNNVKMGKKTTEQKELIDNLYKFYFSRGEPINFFKDFYKMALDAGYKAKHDETKVSGLKILTPKQML